MEFLTLDSWTGMTVIVYPAELVKMTGKKKRRKKLSWNVRSIKGL